MYYVKFHLCVLLNDGVLLFVVADCSVTISKKRNALKEIRLAAFAPIVA